MLMGEVTFDTSILPCDFLVTGRLFEEQEVKAAGEVWQIYKGDADTKFPHAHLDNSSVKLDLRNGDVYKRGRREGNDRKVWQKLVDAARQKGIVW